VPTCDYKDFTAHLKKSTVHRVPPGIRAFLPSLGEISRRDCCPEKFFLR